MSRPGFAVFSVMCLLAIAPIASAQTTPATSEPTIDRDVQRLLDLTGAAKTGSVMAAAVSTQILQMVKQEHPDVPQRALDIARDTLADQMQTAFAPDGTFMRAIAAIYSKHYTHDEILGLIAFYETPLGKKTIENIPAITQESMQVGMDWAQKSMPEMKKKLQDRLRAEGLIK